MTRSSLRAIVLAALLLTATAASAADAVLPRHPAPSPDGAMVAFSWQGDLWLVPVAGGTARRLTAHPASDRHPVWSPDGRMIAFASDRHGNMDVFVMPADASAPPERLTHASVGDTPLDFTPDGAAVLFASGRDESVRWMPALYTVPITGGTPALAQPALGHSAVYSPDGAALAYVRGVTKWTRRGYRGPANRDLWLRTAEGDHVELTDFDGDDDAPSFLADHGLAFLSARSGRKNVFALDLATSEVRQLTFHDGSDVRFPRAAADGSVIAYEFEDGLWTVRPGEAEPHRLTIDVPADLVANPVERRTDRSGADDLVLGPKGELAAFVVHGDVFVVPVMSKEDQEIATPRTVQVTATPARESSPVWAPDGKSLIVVSDRDGQPDLYRLRPAGDAGWLDAFAFDAERLTDTAVSESRPRFVPGGERLAFVRGSGDLVVRELASGRETVLLEHWTEPDFAFSPDGAWVAYAVPDASYNSEIWLVPIGGGEPYNVSRHPDDDVRPRFSPDGKRLVWLSRRHADTFDVWGVWLARADAERTAEDWLAYFKQQGKGAKKNGDDAAQNGDAKADDEPEEPELPEVTVDLDRLWERPEAITSFAGDEDEPLVSADGKRVLFVAEVGGKRDLWSVRYDGDDPERLTEGGAAPSEVQLVKDTAFYLDDDGAIRRVSLEGEAGDPVPFAARYTVDRAAERAQVFEEAWRVLNESFYDPAFHGVDWPAQREKYRPWAMAASTDDDFADVVNLMLGELNASHMGYYPGRGGRGSRGNGGELTGFIGALFDPTAGGPGVLVREVLADGPAATTGAAMVAGERLLAVNGVAVAPGENVYAVFADTVGDRTLLRIRGLDGAERTAVVIPVDAGEEEQLRYRQWVRQRRALVDSWSDGRLGYLHVQGMNMPSFEEFERQLYAAGHGREGLLIDVRSNGGGWTTDYLLAVLQVQRHAYTIPRGGAPETRAYPQSRLPLAAWTRPAATLCNEESYSNAEIFSHAFKTLDRGPLVGWPTFGAVISTGGHSTLDGALVRLPGRGWYVASTGENMELGGAVPDLVVPQPPTEDTSATEDSQLAEAVRVLLERLPEDPRAGAW